MATEAILQSITAPAAADLSAKQYYAITIDTNGNAAIATAAKNCDGFLQNNPKQGQAANVAIFGKTKAVISATVAIGDLLEIGSTGTLVEHATGTVVAKALEAGASGNTITVLMLKSNALYA